MKNLFRLATIVAAYAGLGSCKQQNSKAQEQPLPTAFAAHAGFDLSRIRFDENVTRLFASTLDTEDTDWATKHYDAFREKDSFATGELPAHFFLWKQPRYYFRTQTLDSIARIDNIFFYRIGIETDAQFHPLAITARTKFRDKKDLDSMLTHLFRKWGKTTEELAVQADDKAQIDTMKASGMTDEQIAFMGNTDTQYDLLNYSDNGYFEWRLSDRYVQVSLSKDHEITISTNPAENKNEEYYYAEFILIKKEEYEDIEARQFERSVKTGKQQQELRPYALRRLNPMDNWRLLARLEEAWKKQ